MKGKRYKEVHCATTRSTPGGSADNEDGKTIMRWFKEKCRNCYNGDAAIAMERLRKKTHKAHFGVCIYFFWGGALFVVGEVLGCGSFCGQRAFLGVNIACALS